MAVTCVSVAGRCEYILREFSVPLSLYLRADPGPALTTRQGEVPIPHARQFVGRVAGLPSPGFRCVQNLRT